MNFNFNSFSNFILFYIKNDILISLYFNVYFILVILLIFLGFIFFIKNYFDYKLVNIYLNFNFIILIYIIFLFIFQINFFALTFLMLYSTALSVLFLIFIMLTDWKLKKKYFKKTIIHYNSIYFLSLIFIILNLGWENFDFFFENLINFDFLSKTEKYNFLWTNSFIYYLLNKVPLIFFNISNLILLVFLGILVILNPIYKFLKRNN